MQPKPPVLALKFLRWFCREDFIEEIEGDVTELFNNQYKRSPVKARLKFVWNVLRYFRPGFIKKIKINNQPDYTAMFRHNALMSYRSFLRYKSTFLINIMGLSTGLA